MKKINGNSSIVKDGQFMGLGSVGERFNDEQDNLPTKCNLGQIRKAHLVQNKTWSHKKKGYLITTKEAIIHNGKGDLQ